MLEMKKLLKRISLLFSFLVIFFNSYCSGETSNNDAATSLFLAKESGESGCTVAGLGSQLKAGYTGITTTSQAVSFLLAGDTYYAVMQIKGAQIGTRVVLSRLTKVAVYTSTSCPLELNIAPLAKEGTEYTKTDGSQTIINFTKAGSYLLYVYQKESGTANPLSVLTDGTAVQTVSDSDLADLLNGGSTKTYKFACAIGGGVCQNYYGYLTSCLSGTKQTAKCTETSVVGSCKVTQSSVGYIISVYTAPLTGGGGGTAATHCSGISGSYVDGSTVQTP
ncbi:hypothetical protein [Leptospira bouyouniensis]|uniref:Lipoprotein n=1 Tax=Leptospira bouyouniensis TaxID=2484911 RepID=A0ABY2L5L7_9LEPT|nr:hypothetical protein [Leptospira bouyouniensis]TGK48211.1 hypothetical protein EHQ10_10765 [Leptospira bouyouniensis]TGM80595.1 hypothetical protein EHQ99_13115 [Leptospira bouyouniensis]